jgi:GTP cyclohydrolase I
MANHKGRDAGGAATAADPEGLQSAVRSLIEGLGEDPDREGLRATPRRVAESLRFLTGGYGVDLDKLMNGAIFEDPVDEMVVVKDIELYSLCEHHLLPFFGKCHIGYLPRGRVVGLSKLPRIVDAYAHRLQVQERLTNQIAHAIMKAVRPLGVGVVIEASHLCMKMRGVAKQNSSAVTSCMLGGFKKDNRTRAEFLGFLR